MSENCILCELEEKNVQMCDTKVLLYPKKNNIRIISSTTDRRVQECLIQLVMNIRSSYRLPVGSVAEAKHDEKHTYTVEHYKYNKYKICFHTLPEKNDIKICSDNVEDASSGDPTP